MLIIRDEQPGDREAIHAVHAACFPTDAEARLVDLLRDTGRLRFSLVAEINGEIIGHVAFSPVTAAGAKDGLGLAPVAVLENYRKQGVAAKLIEVGLAACREAGYGWAVVLGAPGYYQRFGFRPASAFGLSDEYGGGSAFQIIEFQEGGIPTNAGLVRYVPEFGMFA